MQRRDGRLLAAGAVVAVAVAVLAVVVLRHRAGRLPSDVASEVATTIPARGATLSAEVVTPEVSGRAPLVVMPASWGSKASEYHAVARMFAAAGYQVVAYAQRGFGGSTGKVDFAGPATQHDVSTVISWALRHTHSDPQRIGLFGTSYGAVASLLAAARDPRIKAVAATSTFAGFASSFNEERTPSTGALHALIDLVKKGSSFDAAMTRLANSLATNPGSLGTAIDAMSPSRSPMHFVEQLNQNKPAILMANAFEDSLFNPGQLVPFYDALTTPKRLELAAGDHGGPEIGGLAGSHNRVVTDSRAWLDRYVRGIRNGIDGEDPIQLEDVRTGELHTYPTWPRAGRRNRVDLPAPGVALTGAPVSSNWSATIRAGTDSGATSGPMQFFAGASYKAPQLALTTIKTRAAFVWDGPPLDAALVLAGMPSLRIGVASSAPRATIFVYLYDVTSSGTGSLIEVQPYTADGLRPGRARDVTIPMQPISWTVSAGNHLGLVVDTVDPRYRSLTPPGATVTVTSTKGTPAWLTAPTS